MTEHELWCNSMQFSAGRAYEVQRRPKEKVQDCGAENACMRCADPLTQMQNRKLMLRFGLNEPQANAFRALIWGAA